MTTMPRNVSEPGNGKPIADQENKGKVSQVAEQAQQKAKEVAHQAQDQAKSAVEVRKERAVEGLDGLAHAFRQTSQALRREDQQMVANYSERMAGQVERISSYLEEHNVDDLLHDAENLARRNPEVFLGGALALGLLLGRFIKSSGERRELARADYYNQPGYPPAPRPSQVSTYSSSGVRETQPSYRTTYSGMSTVSRESETPETGPSPRPSTGNPTVS